MVGRARGSTAIVDVFRAIIAITGLGFFNLIIVLVPFLGLLGVLLGLWAASISVAGTGLAVLTAPWLLPGITATGAIWAVFTSAGLMSLGGLCCAILPLTPSK